MAKPRVRAGATAPANGKRRTGTVKTWGEWRLFLSHVALVVVAVAACLAGFGNGFVQDDEAILLADSRLRDFTAWREILTLPYWPPPSLPDQYRPVTSFLLALQNVIGSGEPTVFRIVSYLLYAGAALSVFLLARRCLPVAIALGVALLFAAHPVHVEATALAVAQSEILVTLLIVAAVSLYVARRLSPSTLLSWRDWALIVSFYFLAAFSKEQGLLLPAFLVVAELCLIRDTSRRSRVSAIWKGYALLAVLGIAVLGVRFLVLREQAIQPNVAEALVGKTVGERVLTMLRVVPEWVRLLAWPVHLRLDYSPQEFVASTAFGGREALGVALLLIAGTVAWLARARAPVVTLGLLWCALALLPVSNVVVPTGVLIAERTLLLPSVGFVLAAGGAAAYVAQRWRVLAIGRQSALMAVGCLVALGIARSAARQRVWRDNDSLTRAAVRDSPRSWRAHANNGDLLFAAGQSTQGAAEYQKAIQLATWPWWVRNSFARQLRAIGDEQGALEQLGRSLTAFPRQPEATRDFVAVLLALGKYEQARTIAVRVNQSEGFPAVMVQLQRLADSAIAVRAPVGSIRIGFGTEAAAPRGPSLGSPLSVQRP